MFSEENIEIVLGACLQIHIISVIDHIHYKKISIYIIWFKKCICRYGITRNCYFLFSVESVQFDVVLVKNEIEFWIKIPFFINLPLFLERKKNIFKSICLAWLYILHNEITIVINNMIVSWLLLLYNIRNVNSNDFCRFLANEQFDSKCIMKNEFTIVLTLIIIIAMKLQISY